MSPDKDDLDKDIDRDEFKANVMRLAHDIYVRGLNLGQDGLKPRVSATQAVETAVALVMVASDEAFLRKVTGQIASKHPYRDPLAES